MWSPGRQIPTQKIPKCPSGPGRKIYLYFNDLNKAKRDVDPNEENKCVMVLLIGNKKNPETYI